ncbi:diguanylate cyclase, partial [Pseudomonas sp. GW247-3R2A]
VYSLVKGQRVSVEVEQWLEQSVDAILDQAREGAETETPTTTFINVGGIPALVAAAAITPGTDPTVIADDRSASVLIFVEMLDSAKLATIGRDFGVDGLHTAAPDEIPLVSAYPLGEAGAAGVLQWSPHKPGLQLLALGLPLVGLAALLVCLMTWVILRRTTA